ncbi:MAG: hypothetical protein SLAVMIC_00987 [uncultured marine phage]|uniref:Uncharacterized protein n=1 Tax=uncultured marine phage TaxID=707152 RepID=A0A8D9FQP2_9VIRU|nr:MAG: hypothetical protein SLAVMIC_00987 [uncultured marine phage]
MYKVGDKVVIHTKGYDTPKRTYKGFVTKTVRDDIHVRIALGFNIKVNVKCCVDKHEIESYKSYHREQRFKKLLGKWK